MVHATQRSPRVPPVNKATWSFESFLPRERKQSEAGPKVPVHQAVPTLSIDRELDKTVPTTHKVSTVHTEQREVHLESSALSAPSGSAADAREAPALKEEQKREEKQEKIEKHEEKHEEKREGQEVQEGQGSEEKDENARASVTPATATSVDLGQSPPLEATAIAQAS